MATVLQETFTGSGSLHGKSPDTGAFLWRSNFGSWDGNAVTLSGGYGTCAAAVNPYDTATASYPQVGAVLSADATQGFTLSTTVNLQVSAGDVTQFFVGIEDAGTGRYARLIINNFYNFEDPPVAEFLLNFAVYSSGGLVAYNEVPFTFVPGTDYALVWSYLPGATGAHTITGFGQNFTVAAGLANAVADVTNVKVQVCNTAKINDLNFGITADFGPPEETLTATLTCPAGNLSSSLSDATGRNAAYLTAPKGLLSAVLRNTYGDNAEFLAAPSGKATAAFGSSAKLSSPKPLLSAAMTGTAMLRASLTAPLGSLEASGVGSPFALSAALSAPIGNLVGYGGMVVSITSPTGFTTSATKTGGVMGAAMTAPLFELSSETTRDGMLSASLTAPMIYPAPRLQAWLIAPGFQLTAIGTAVVVPTYEAYAVNLNHPPAVRGQEAPVDETTRYTNYPFTHIVRYQNSYYGANSTGLYLLEGTTDDAAPIPWEFKTTITDFESPMGKTAVSAYFAGRMGPAATVGIHLGESGDVSYSHSTPRGPAAQNYRQVFGLGLKARYYALSVAGEGVMELDSIEFNNKTLSRRI